MKRLDLGNLPPASMGQDARWAWVSQAFSRIAQASRRDDDFNALAAKMATLYGSATYNPASLGTGAIDSPQTIAVAGAALGMKVDASFSLDLQGIAINAWVSAANTVKVQFRNPTAGTIDLGSGTVRVRVWTHTP